MGWALILVRPRDSLRQSLSECPKAMERIVRKERGLKMGELLQWYSLVFKT